MGGRCVFVAAVAAVVVFVAAVAAVADATDTKIILGPLFSIHASGSGSIV